MKYLVVLTVLEAPGDISIFQDKNLVTVNPSHPVKLIMQDDSILLIDCKAHGAVSIPFWVIKEGGYKSYTQWITLFETSDNEYDGAMGLNDLEEPRVQLTF
jgi:hypothetical protein